MTAQETKKEVKETKKAPAPKKAGAKPKFVRFQNVSDNPVRIHGATLRPDELSQKFTTEQADVMKVHLKPYLDAGYIKLLDV